MSESYWKERCKSNDTIGRRCMNKGSSRFGGYCWAHSEEGRRVTAERTNKREPVVLLPESQRCQSTLLSGAPCPSRAARDYGHCWHHLRIAWRNAAVVRTTQQGTEPVRTPRPSPSEQRRIAVAEQHRNEKRLEEDNVELRRQITDLSIELDRTKEELRLARAWRKPVVPAKVNGANA